MEVSFCGVVLGIGGTSLSVVIFYSSAGTTDCFLNPKTATTATMATKIITPIMVYVFFDMK